MFKEHCEVIENKEVALNHFVLKVRSKKISKNAKPGQFVQILCGENSLDPLLARPFSFLTASGGDFSVLYHVVGHGTRLMAKFKKGDKVPVLGPMGNGFTAKPEVRVLVGGGVGIPPLYHLTETWVKDRTAKKDKIHVFLGARNKSLLLCEKEFKKLGVALTVATEDGSRGTKGFITVALEEFLRSAVASKTGIFTCGPTPMLKAVSALATKRSIPCEVSVEVPMACGFGACLGCALKVKGPDPGSHRFAIACVEGPVFEGSRILWE